MNSCKDCDDVCYCGYGRTDHEGYGCGCYFYSSQGCPSCKPMCEKCKRPTFNRQDKVSGILVIRCVNCNHIKG